MYDLRQIQCFVAVAEELHYGRAAARLNMTKPPLSRQIALLEHELNFKLFERVGRSITLSHAGRVFYSEAKRLFSLAENAADNAKRVAAGDAGLIKIGFTAGSSYSFLPRLLAHTDAYLKGVEIVLFEMLTRDQLTSLRSHAIDVAFLRPVFGDIDIESLCVARESLLLAIPRNHRLARGKMPRLSDIVDERFVAFHPVDGAYFRSLIDRALKNAGVNVRCVQSVGQVHSILALVSGGQGIALVPESARSMNFKNIVLRPVRTESVVAELVMAWMRDNQNPALSRFLRSSRRLAAEQQHVKR